MDIIYVGSVITDSNTDKITGISIAGNKMELGVIKNVARDCDNLFVISVPPIAPYPKDKHIYFNAKTVCDREENIKHISFINISILKQISQIINTYFAIRKTMQQAKNPILLSYNMFPQNGLPALLAHKMFKSELATIIADPPIDEVENRSLISGILYRIYNALSEKCIRSCKNLIVVNKEIIPRYCPLANYIVVEGGVEVNSFQDDNAKENTDYSIKNIVYSGSLTEYSGILRLIQAMKIIKIEDVELHIYGSGPLEADILDLTKTMGNTIYFGKVSNEQIIEIQKKAWFLINPRVIDNPISKYAFPSKIFEYMLSGTPIITTKLNGFSDEYNKYLIYSDGDKPMDFCNLITKIRSDSYLKYKKMAEEAKKFILKNKNWKAQASKIRDFLENCN